MLIGPWPMADFEVAAVRGEIIRNLTGCRASAKRNPECQGKIAFT